MAEHLTLQELISRRQARGFVGRADELGKFAESLSLPVDDPRRRFLFSLHGHAGAGKTFLVRQFVRLASERDWITAYVDETAVDVLSALSILAADMERQGARCKGFSERLEAYRRRRTELDVDPGAPEGLPLLLTRSAVRVGLRAATDMPFLGAIAEEFDADAVANQVDRLRVYLNRKLRSQDDVRLMLAPIEELTRVFLEDLSATAKRRPVALFCDTYERTGTFLDPWLLDMLTGRFGAMSANFVLTIAGQLPLDTNRWGDYLDLRADLPMRVFTDAEARQLLTSRGVTNEHVIDVILALSGRLPLLVAMLAEGRPTDPTAVGDPSGSAVERFLKWEPSAGRRAAALHGAFPRRLDQDILAVATESASAAADFEWLRPLPFVAEHADGFRYHDVVRSQMLRVSRRRVPADWKRRHNKLADHFQAERDTLQLSGRAAWQDGTWQSLAIEKQYHRICALGSSAIPVALGGLVDALAWRQQDARRWAQMIEQAGLDTDTPEIQQRGSQLAALIGESPDDQIRLLDELICDATLDETHRGTAHGERASIYQAQAKYGEALTDHNHAVQLQADTTWLIGGRGQTYLAMERYAEALADFNRAIELDPTADWAIASRGETYRMTERYAEALADFNRAIELDPKYEWAIASRGETYRMTERYAEALADFNRAIELDPKYGWAIANRGETYWMTDRYEEALTDFNRAIELDPKYGWAIANRGQTYLAMERYAEALADYTRAIELDPKSIWVITERGKTYRAMGRYEEALADYNRAIELNPKADWAIANRGETHRMMERYEEALADFNRAIELYPKYEWAIASRGQTYRAMERHEEALADYNRAIELDPTDAWWQYEMAVVMLMAHDAPAARDRLRRAITMARQGMAANPTKTHELGFDIVVYLAALGETDQAERQLQDVMAMEPPTWRRAEIARDLRDLHRVTGLDVNSLLEILSA